MTKGYPQCLLDDEESNDSPAHRLANLISDLSEETYAAGWLDGIEYDLWRCMMGADSELGLKYGMGTISPEHFKHLRALSQECGGWVSWFDEDEGDTGPAGVRFVTYDDWVHRLAARTKRDKDRLEAFKKMRVQQAFQEDERRRSEAPAAITSSDDDDDRRRRGDTAASAAIWEAVATAFDSSPSTDSPSSADSAPSYDGGTSDFSGGGGDGGGGGASGDW